MAKVAFIVDSEYGLSKVEAEERGYFFIPITIEFNGKEMESGVDMTLDFLHKNMTKESRVKTAAPSLGKIAQAYRDALKDNDHAIYLPITKHLSSTMNYAMTVAEEDEFKGKVTVIDSEYLGPWGLYLDERLHNMVVGGAEVEEFLELLEKHSHHMKAFAFPENLESVYASGRVSKAQYLAGSLLKISPVLPIVQGSIRDTGVIKARSHAKALKVVVQQTVNVYNEVKELGEDPVIMIACLGAPDDNKYLADLKELFREEGHNNVPITWLPPAITGHIGVGGIGAGVVLRVDPEYTPKK